MINIIKKIVLIIKQYFFVPILILILYPIYILLFFLFRKYFISTIIKVSWNIKRMY